MTIATPAVAVPGDRGVGSARPGIRRGVPFEDGENRLELGAQVLHRLGRERAPRLRLELPAAAVLLDLLARPFDRVLLRVEEMLHEHDQLDLAPLVDTVPRAVLGGVQEPELALPVPQDVRLQVGELADLADGKEFLDGMRDAHRHCSALSSRSIRSATACAAGLPRNSTSATSRPHPSSTPSWWLRDSGPVAVRIRSPIPASPAKVAGSAPSATPRRVISARPRVISAARVLWPRPSPSRIPAARAITFLSAPPSSTPRTSVAE